MGMDLIPTNPSKAAPRYPLDAPYFAGRIISGSYNWSGWSWLCDKLQQWGVVLEGFSHYNDGEVIREAKCREVANAIEKHLPELEKECQEWLAPHVALWRTCGGYRQW
jgi:hypothetical protein